MNTRVLLVFLDGVGIGEPDPEVNPFAAERYPGFEMLLGGALTSATPSGGAGAAVWRGLDACLGVSGRPQSGTGQTTLLTGDNAAAMMGRHFGPWVPTDLREHLATRSLFERVRGRGRAAAFANCYPSMYVAQEAGHRRPGAFPYAARAAGLLVRDEHAFRRGDGLVSSITSELWRQHVDASAPHTGPGDAADRLARIARANDLTVFAHYDTDHIGHRGDREAALEATRRVDRFLGELFERVDADTTVIVTSDHGNLEDLRGGHTFAPVPLIAWGPAADRVVSGAASIGDVAPRILDLLGEMRGPGTEGETPAGAT